MIINKVLQDCFFDSKGIINSFLLTSVGGMANIEWEGTGPRYKNWIINRIFYYESHYNDTGNKKSLKLKIVQ